MDVGRDTAQHGPVRYRSARYGRRLGRVVGWVLVPLITGFVLVVVAVTLPDALAAATGHGIHGTFVAGYQSCSRNGCTTYGSFRSDDGTVTETGLVYDQAPRHFIKGASSRVLYEGDTEANSVYSEQGSTEWLWITLFGLLALTILTTWVVVVAARVTGRTAPRWARWLQSRGRGI
jgi:hypothetical protein